jgi:hypothetical protein
LSILIFVERKGSKMRYFLIILGCLLYACAGSQVEPEAAPKAEPVEAVEPAAEAPAAEAPAVEPAAEDVKPVEATPAEEEAAEEADASTDAKGE